MLSISKNVSTEYTIKKSKFISFIFRVDNIDEVNYYLKKLNEEYNDRTHLCFAYIIDNIKRFNDDKEPNGTAGMPILNVLENNNLNHIMCCIVRYFGGIKLGTGGLVKAYTNSCILALNKTNIIELIKGKLCTITFNYENAKTIDSIINDPIEKTYNEKITYKIKANNEIIDELKKYCEIKEISECYIEKSH